MTSIAMNELHNAALIFDSNISNKHESKRVQLSTSRCRRTKKSYACCGLPASRVFLAKLWHAVLTKEPVWVECVCSNDDFLTLSTI